MKIILLEDVRSLGKKGQIVEVSTGYARNALIPQKKGVEATPAALNSLKLSNKHEEKVAQENLEAAKKLKTEVEKGTVRMSIRTGENGKVFGSVSAKEIADAAKDQLGLDIDKKKIVMDGPIKETGVSTVQVKLHPQVTAALKVQVDAEK